MVNLKNIEGAENNVGEFRARSHHMWGASLGQRNAILRRQPTTLHQLEDLAWRTVELMKKHGTDIPDGFTMAMDLLREQYRLNFLFVCHECVPGTHKQDEIVAPER